MLLHASAQLIAQNKLLGVSESQAVLVLVVWVDLRVLEVACVQASSLLALASVELIVSEFNERVVEVIIEV